ncbi:MAG: ABC transporter permease [Thiotrichaceae bacterium]|nr:ABC transporter permease [Thiotrichaceae bacterium]
MKMSFLWTDMMIWLLVVALIFWARMIMRSPQTRQQWRRIYESPLAMACSLILLTYLSVALLDSIHFRLALPTQADSKQVNYDINMKSPLDLLFAHNIDHSERTYSAPFARNEFVSSIIVNEQGITEKAYLPLKHVATYLGINEGSGLDIFIKSIIAIIMGLMIGLIFVTLHMLWLKRGTQDSFGHYLQTVKQGKTQLPWRWAYATFLFILVMSVWLYYLNLSYHVLGTDKVGGDVLYNTLKSIRTGVLIGVLTTVATLPISIILGISAGYIGGWVDDVIQYIYTTLSSIPSVLLIAASILVVQVTIDNNPQWFETATERSDLRLFFLIIILSITSWTGLCRLLRAETFKLSQVEFVTAARAFGVGKFTILRRHILPNLMHIILISVVLDFSFLVLSEAVLSYVGVGVDPSMHSWGNMINQARLEMAREPMVWWSLLSAFLFMFVLVLAANLFSDRIQVVLDPRNEA